MGKLYIDIELDVAKGATTLSRPRTVQLRRGEEGSTVIRARAVHEGADWPLDGYTASFMAIMPGDLEVMDDACSVSGSVIEYEVPGVILGHRGRTDLAYFSLTREGEDGVPDTLTTQGFSINVNTGVDMSAAEYESYMPAVSRIVEEAASSVRAAAASALLSQRDLADYKERAEGAVSDALAAAGAAGAIAGEAERAEAERRAAEDERREQESARVGAEAQRQSLWEDIVQRSRGWLRRYCGDGEYDPGTLEPTVGEPDAGTLYFVPMEVAGAGVMYAKWMWDGEGGRWEALGVPKLDVAPMTAEQVEAIVAGEAVSGGEVATAATASALWRGAVEAFSAAGHGHSAGDITSGTLPVERGGTGVTTARELALKAYPVGAVYFSYDKTSPAALFGGTWAQMTGRFVRMADDVATGGADTHTLTSAQMPNHVHGLWYKTGWGSGGGGSTGYYTYSAFSSVGNSWDATTTDTGSGGAHNNMPAYQDLYAWRRTA